MVIQVVKNVFLSKLAPSRRMENGGCGPRSPICGCENSPRLGFGSMYRTKARGFPLQSRSSAKRGMLVPNADSPSSAPLPPSAEWQHRWAIWDIFSRRGGGRSSRHGCKKTARLLTTEALSSARLRKQRRSSANQKYVHLSILN